MEERSIGEKCGIFGVYGEDDAARLVHAGLYALQHRGQECSGIVSSDREQIYVHKGMGLVAHVYDETILQRLRGHLSIGHNRYSTFGGSSEQHVQPVFRPGCDLALAHNGNLPSVYKLGAFLEKIGRFKPSFNDSEMIYEAIRYYVSVLDAPLEDALFECYPLLTGAFSLLVMTKNKLAALRDPKGIRPLSMAELNGSYIFSSETCATDTIGAVYTRDVLPGKMVVVGEEGDTTYTLLEGKQQLDIFEFVYFARPSSVLLGKNVYQVRENLGKKLALEYPLESDIIVPVPDSAIPAALGYSEIMGIPPKFGLEKNRYIHRTFISPGQRLRERGVKMKLIPIQEVLNGKSVTIIDDSIVRGTTSKKIVEMVRNKGAKRVNVLISSPPVQFPDFYGIDTPSQKDLIAYKRTVEEIRKFIGADYLGYLSYRGLIDATGLPETVFSTSCFSGIYPIDIGEKAKEIEFRELVRSS